MNHSRTTLTLSLLASAIMATSAQAAAPSLVTQTFGNGTTNATFAGGVTLNNGTTYAGSVPFGQAAHVVAGYMPGSEAGKEADQYMVVNERIGRNRRMDQGGRGKVHFRGHRRQRAHPRDSTEQLNTACFVMPNRAACTARKTSRALRVF